MCRPMIQFYVESMRVKGRKPMPSTTTHVEEVLNRIFDSLEADFDVEMREKRIVGLDSETLMRWFNKASADWKPATFNNYISIMNPFFRWASKIKSQGVAYIDDDLSTVLRTQSLPSPEDLPEDQRPKDKYFSVAQVQDLMHGDHGRNHVRDTALIAIFLWSGIRVSELCQVTVGNYRNGKEKHVVSVQRKGGAWKEVDIGEPAYAYVEKYLSTRPSLEDSQPLFMTTHGKPCTRQQIYKCLSYKQKQIGIATGPHALRHTNLSALEKGSSPSIVRDVANHKDFHVTNRYTHSTHEERLAALNALPWK